MKQTLGILYVSCSAYAAFAVLFGWMLMVGSVQAENTILEVENTQSTDLYAADEKVRLFLQTVVDARTKEQAYSGTFIVSDGRAMVSTRMQYACDGKHFVESMEALSGKPQTTAYDDQRMYSRMPEQKRMVVAPYFRSVIPLHALHKADVEQVSKYYKLKDLPQERVAGLPTKAVALQPRDDLRYGYRIWVHEPKNWVLKMETVHGEKVLERMEFTAIQPKSNAQKELNALKAHTQPPDGYAVEDVELSSAQARKNVPIKWVLDKGVPGFNLVRQQVYTNGVNRVPAHHWVLSDGLATMSLFIESFDESMHKMQDDGQFLHMGCNSAHFKRDGDDWLVATGEVPARTLRMLLNDLKRKP